MLKKNELLSAVAKDAGLTKAQVEAVFDGMAKVATSFINENKSTNAECKADTSIRIPSLGTLYVTYQPGRKGVNPRNPKEIMTIDPYYRFALSVNKSVKDAINADNAPKKKKKAAAAAAPASKGKAAKATTSKKAAPKKPAKKAPIIIDDDEDDDD